MRRILLAQTSFLGDVVLTTALARAIRDAHPEIEIWWLVRPDAAAVIAPLAGPDRVLTFAKRGADAGWSGMWRTAARLRGIDFDAAIAVQRSLRTAALLAVARIPLRIGFADAPGALLYSRRVPRSGAHARDRLLALAGPLLVNPRDPLPSPELRVDPDAVRSLEAKLRAAGVRADERLLVLAPGSAWPTKRWLPQHFGGAAAAMLAGRADRALVIGAAADRPLAAQIQAQLGTHEQKQIVDLTGETSVAEMIAALGRATLVLANDSAPAHIAAALGKPVVVVFGPTVPAQGFAPLGPHVRIAERTLACRPCSRHGGVECPIGTHECMRDLAPQVVVDAATELLDEVRGSVAAAAPQRRVAPGHERL